MPDPLLIVKHRLPFPLDAGTDVVSYANWRALQGPFALTVVAADEGERSRSGARHLRDLGIEVLLAPGAASLAAGRTLAGKLVRNAKRLLWGLPSEYQATARPAFAPLLHDLTRRRSFALAQFEYWTTARYRRFAHCPALLLNHDLWHLTVSRIARHQASPWRRLLWGLEARATRRHERAANRGCEQRLFLSEEDRVAMLQLDASLEGRVLPALFPFPPVPAGRVAAAGGEPLVLFFGTLSAPFNIDAACHFASQVWPAILAAVPRARFVIAGRDPAPAVRACGALPGVEVAGEVADLDGLLARTWVAVSPGRIGTGIKVKVAQAMAAGVAVVGTPTGLSGFSEAPGLVRAALGEEFAGEVVALLRDADRRRRVAGAAHGFYAGQVCGGRAAERVVALYRSILKSVE